MVHRDDVNHGSQIAICRQAHIKLEVVFFMYLWSIDPEAVQVSMSCFSLLCEEADIRCRSDEITSTFLLPNYQVGASKLYETHEHYLHIDPIQRLGYDKKCSLNLRLL